MFIKKEYIVLVCAIACVLHCGSSSASARNVTHPVMVGPVPAIKAKDKVAVTGAFEITLTNESFASAGGAAAREEGPGKMDAHLLRVIKTTNDQVTVKEVKYKNYYLGFIPIVAGVSNDAVLLYDFKAGSVSEDVKGKKK